jgi:hypothetical protein
LEKAEHSGRISLRQSGLQQFAIVLTQQVQRILG